MLGFEFELVPLLLQVEFLLTEYQRAAPLAEGLMKHA
jgi:hypothetical protein